MTQPVTTCGITRVPAVGIPPVNAPMNTSVRSRRRRIVWAAWPSGLLWLALLGLPVLGSVACGDLAGTAALPAGTQSPTAYNTPTGALAMYRGTLAVLESVLPQLIYSSGLLTDELTAAGLGSSSASIGGIGDPIDERMLTEQTTGGDVTYASLQKVRASATQAIGLLQAYAPATSPAVRGKLYALAGFAELSLAELYCSGVPLSTLDFQQDFTYKPSSTTDEVLRHAQALLDSAVALSSDSLPVVWLAQVLKGRALLDRGLYDSAALAVAPVPDTFRYQLSAVVNFPLTSNNDGSVNGNVVATGEGENGLPFHAAQDPRVPVTLQRTNPFGLPLYTPDQYTVSGSVPSPVVLASGVEARLIEAEALVHANPASPDPRWLTILNTLRTDGTVARTYTRTCQNGISLGDGTVVQTGSPCPAGVIDTTWGPGSGAGLILSTVLADTAPVCTTSLAPGDPCADTVWYRGLRPLTDPGSDTGRVNLVFAERAYWLFLTGHRQGDLRRLVRNYGRDQRTVYPIGAYYGGLGRYGADVNLPIPGDERLNPLFHGCQNRGA